MIADLLYQVTALASVVTFGGVGFVLRRWIGQMDERRQERRR